MLNTLKQSLRMLKAFRLFSIINIIGLSIGLACTMIIVKYIYQELTVDHFHHDYRRIYGITVESGNAGEPIRLSRYYGVYGNYRFHSAPPPDSVVKPGEPVDPEKFTSIETSTEVSVKASELIGVGPRNFTSDLVVADTNFFKVFDFPLQAGNPDKILTERNGVILSPATARRFFGDEEPLGKTVTIFRAPFTVTGIFAPCPGKTMFALDVMISGKVKESAASYMFYKMYPNADVDAMNRRLPFGRYNESRQELSRFQYIPLKEIYLGAAGTSSTISFLSKGNPQSLRILGVIALVVFVIGIFNFINIYTVVLLKRGKELGIKKLFGVDGVMMLRQFACENFLMVTAATTLALGMLTACNSLLQARLGINTNLGNPFDLVLTGTILIVVPMLTILYPYFKYRKETPVSSLKELGRTGGARMSRALFMFAQYLMTIVLIIVSIYFVRQLSFMLRADPGYSTQNTIRTSLLTKTGKNPWEDEQLFDNQRQKARLIENELSRSPLIRAWTACNSPIDWTRYDYRTGFRNPNQGADFIPMLYVPANAQFTDVFDIEIVEGRAPNAEEDWLSGDRPLGVVINQTAQKLLNVRGVGDMIHSEQCLAITVDENDNIQKHNKECLVVGIIRDFSFDHLSRAVTPIILGSRPNEISAMGGQLCTISYLPGKERETISFLQELSKQINPSGDFSYTLLADEVAALYAEDRKVATINSTFALVAILISSLGLFSLSIYDVQQRRREIAIRRVNGASISEIIRMLTRKYYRLLLLAFVVAAPIAGYAIHRYTEHFAHKAPLSWWIFLLAGGVTAAISLLTLWWQTYRAATENPAKAVKTE